MGAQAASRSIHVILSAAPVSARGGRRVQSLSIGDPAGGSARETLQCDTILTAGGWNPAVHLHSQSGGSLAFDEALQAFLPSHSAPEAACVGAAAGQIGRAHVRPPVTNAPLECRLLLE